MVGFFSSVIVSPTRVSATSLIERGQEADLARSKHGRILHFRRERSDAVDLIGRIGADHLDALALFQRAVEDTYKHDDAEIGVVPAVDEERLQRRVDVALRRRQARDDGFEHVGNAEAGLGRNLDGVRGIEADHFLDLLLHPIGLGGGQVDLVQDRHDLVVGVERVIDVRERLRFDALGRVHDQKRAFAGRERARDLIGEVDMPGRVHQIEDVGLPVLGRIGQAHGLRLDRDSALLLDIHRIRAPARSSRAPSARR